MNDEQKNESRKAQMKEHSLWIALVVCMIFGMPVWHQFVFLLDQYNETKGASQSFIAFLPSQAIDYPITMERVSTPAYQVAGQTTKTRRYHIVANKVLSIEMWTDDRRVPPLFYSAAQQLKIIRTG
jgi:hypothetical protein